jgi:hypothetical protein
MGIRVSENRGYVMMTTQRLVKVIPDKCQVSVRHLTDLACQTLGSRFETHSE